MVGGYVIQGEKESKIAQFLKEQKDYKKVKIPVTDSVYTEFPYRGRWSFVLGAKKIASDIWNWIKKQKKFKNFKSEDFISIEKYSLYAKNPKIEYYRVYGKNKKFFDDLVADLDRPMLEDEPSESEEEPQIQEEEDDNEPLKKLLEAARRH